jgi:hypothetical protein
MPGAGASAAPCHLPRLCQCVCHEMRCGMPSADASAAALSAAIVYSMRACCQRAHYAHRAALSWRCAVGCILCRHCAHCRRVTARTACSPPSCARVVLLTLVHLLDGAAAGGMLDERPYSCRRRRSADSSFVVVPEVCCASGNTDRGRTD